MRKDLVDRKAEQQPVLDHLLAAADHLLGRLENEHHSAVEAVGLGQQLCRSEQDGRVAVMTAGMHDALIAGGVWNVGGFPDRQRVELGAQRNGAPAAAPGQRGDNRGLAHIGMDREAELPQPRGDEGRRFVFGKAQLGIGMDVAAPADDLLHDLRDPVVVLHRRLPGSNVAWDPCNSRVRRSRS